MAFAFSVFPLYRTVLFIRSSLIRALALPFFRGTVASVNATLMLPASDTPLSLSTPPLSLHRHFLSASFFGSSPVHPSLSPALATLQQCISFPVIVGTQR